MSGSTGIRLGVLGPLSVCVQGVEVPVTAARQRAVLGCLLVRVNRIVPFEELAELVWDGSPPAAARVTLRSYVMRLRNVLGSEFSDRVVTRDPGYLFRAGEDELDLLAFTGLCGAGQVAIRAGEWQRASDVLGRALALWRGPALVDVPLEALHREEVPRLERSRLQAVEWRIEADLQLGGHEALVEELRSLVERHPLRERLHAQLMRALSRCGRRAEALEVYRQARRMIVEELGVEPDQDLRDLHQAILRAEADLPGQPAADRTGTADAHPDRLAADVPHQLPAPVRHFTGRDGEVQMLTGLVAGEAIEVAEVINWVVDGMAGVGKTALVVHAARRLTAHYPDGQLFVDLHGFTEGTAPVEPAAALAGMLRALGVAGERIPDGLEERAALFRTRLAGRRVLIVLDNAVTESQIDPLLPGDPGCLVLVTSRRRLAGLDGVEPLSLDVLPLPDAVVLFARTVGADRGMDPAVARDIVDLCGRLPLAIRIAAARLRHRPGWTATHLVDLLRGRHGALAALESGQRSVAASVHLSYVDLAPDQQRMFRLLGLHPGTEVEPYAAAALVGGTEHQAVGLLEDLCDAHLLDQPAPGRYRMHDLVRAHAIHLVGTDPLEPDGRAALTRLFDYYADTASMATDVLYPHENSLPAEARPATASLPVLDAPVRAAAWLDTELANLLAAAFRATELWPAHTIALSATLHPHLNARARYTDAQQLHHAAAMAARRTADRRGESAALTNAGTIRFRRGHLDQAVRNYEEALRIARDGDDRRGELLALVGLGNTHRVRARHGPAAHCLDEALRIARDIDNPAGMASALHGLGYIRYAEGRYQQGAECFEPALDIAVATGHRANELNALIALGRVSHSLGRYHDATHFLERALDTARATGYPSLELEALLGLGHNDRARGLDTQAVHRFEQAMGIATATGYANGQLIALIGLGAIHYLCGRHAEAADSYRRALDIAQDIGIPYSAAIALVGLGHVFRLRGRHDQAIDSYRQALGIGDGLDDKNVRFEAVQGLGRAHDAMGQPDEALVDHLLVLDLARELEQRDDQVRALDGVARAYRALGYLDQARQHWQDALDILTDLGLTRVEDVDVDSIRSHLAVVAAQPEPDRSSGRSD